MIDILIVAAVLTVLLVAVEILDRRK